jgi:hypothetical protein
VHPTEVPADYCTHMVEFLEKNGLLALCVQNKCVEVLVVLGQVKIENELIDPRIAHVISRFKAKLFIPHGVAE